MRRSSRNTHRHASYSRAHKHARTSDTYCLHQLHSRAERWRHYSTRHDQHRQQLRRLHNADHDPASGRCPTSTWRAGDRILDRFTTTLDAKHSPGSYVIWTGFFTGWAPRFRNLIVTDAPVSSRGDLDSHPNAIRLGEIRVE